MKNFKLKSGLKDSIMDEDKKNRLENAGFKVGSVEEFLNLTQEEQAKIDNIIIRNGKPIGICECLQIRFIPLNGYCVSELEILLKRCE